MSKQSYNWCFTINNPQKVITCGKNDKFKDLTFDTDDKLVAFLQQYDEINYYVFQREQGHEEKTTHIQGFVQFKNKKRGQTIGNMFPSQFFHNEVARGTAQQASDYCKKSDTRIGEVIEWGELRTKGGKQLTNEMILERIKDGADNIKLLQEFPELLFQIDRLDKVRQEFINAEYKDKWRNVTTTYIFGKSGAGKTRNVMEEYGYSNVYRITDYKHPFDGYKGQKVLVFEEFRNSLPIDSMLNYLDGYPLELPCRYSNKIAVFDTVYIISNWSFNEQYTKIQEKYFETWNAFCRRINNVKEYSDDGIIYVYSSDSYILKHNLQKSKGGDSHV